VTSTSPVGDGGGASAPAQAPTEAAAVVKSTSPRPIRLPYYRFRRYTNVRVDQLIRENQALDLPFRGGFVKSMLELEAEAERQSLTYASKSRLYASLYYILGLPAAILAAIAGATALASATGRYVAGIIALASSALSAAVVYLDSGKQRDRAAQTRNYWDDLYTEIHVARLTKMIDYDVDTGPAALNRFYTKTSNIRAGRDPEDDSLRSAAPGRALDVGPDYLFPEERARLRPRRSGS